MTEAQYEAEKDELEDRLFSAKKGKRDHEVSWLNSQLQKLEERYAKSQDSAADAGIGKCPECGQKMSDLKSGETNAHIDGEIRKLYKKAVDEKVTDRIIALERFRKSAIYGDAVFRPDGCRQNQIVSVKGWGNVQVRTTGRTEGLGMEGLVEVVYGEGNVKMIPRKDLIGFKDSMTKDKKLAYKYKGYSLEWDDEVNGPTTLRSPSGEAIYTYPKGSMPTFKGVQAKVDKHMSGDSANDEERNISGSAGPATSGSRDAFNGCPECGLIFGSWKKGDIIEHLDDELKTIELISRKFDSPDVQRRVLRIKELQKEVSRSRDAKDAYFRNGDRIKIISGEYKGQFGLFLKLYLSGMLASIILGNGEPASVQISEIEKA